MTLRELFEAGKQDEDFLVFVTSVVNTTINTRAEQQRTAESRQQGG